MKLLHNSVMISFLLIFCFNNPVKGEYLFFSGEKFDIFIDKFSTDSAFQMSRVQFPLQSVGFKDGFFDQQDTTLLSKKDWKHVNLFDGMEYHPQIYDNFECSLKNTDERVIAYEGVRNGINMKYFFKRINNKWFLVKIEDFST